MKKLRLKKGISLILLIAMCLPMFTGLNFTLNAEEVMVKNGSFEELYEKSESLDGWKLTDGFTVDPLDKKDGENALLHDGVAEGKAIAENLSLEKGKKYLFSAWIKLHTDEASLSVSIEGTEYVLTTSEVGTWKYCQAFVINESMEACTVTVTAKGKAAVDSISLLEITQTNEELVVGGDFESGISGWSGYSTSTVVDGAQYGVEGKVLKFPGPSVATLSSTVAVEKNTWYVFSADVYRSSEKQWVSCDMFPLSEETRIKSEKVGQWEHISCLWYSGSNTSTYVRAVRDSNWDNAATSQSDGKWGLVDNISLIKANVGEELISDGSFTKDGWLLNENATIAKNKGKGDSNALKTAMTQGSAGSAIAIANGGEDITVTPHRDYMLTAWVFVTGTPKTVTAILDMNGVEGELKLTSTTYNHDKYNANYWVQMSGIWNSGENTSVKIRAILEPTVTGKINDAYIDGISFRAVDTYATEGEVMVNGGFDEYYFSTFAKNWTLPENGVSIETKNPAIGKKALVLTGENISAVSDTVKLAPRSAYVLSGWMYLENGAQGEIATEDGSVKLTSSVSGKWQYLNTSFVSDSKGSLKLLATVKKGSVKFDDIKIVKASGYYNPYGSILSDKAERTVLSSLDTSMTVAVEDNKLYIEELKNVISGYSWVSASGAQELPLITTVNDEATRWQYVGKSISKDDGTLLTLTFKNTDPAMEMKLYFQVYPGEMGPVQYWGEIENKSGKDLTFHYADVISGDIVVTAKGKTTLTTLEKRSYTGSNMSNKVKTKKIGSDFESISNVINDTVWNGNHEMPYGLLTTENGEGLYYGYYWSFGLIKVETEDDPEKVHIVSTLGDSGSVVRKVNNTDGDGDGNGDADMNLQIPGMFFGAFNGTIDEGSNRMKNWYWHHRMTETLRENENEPLVELHLPYNSENEWKNYLSSHSLASWGVQLVKQDYWWTTANNPPSSSAFNAALESQWEPYPTKWPNGMTLGKIAHAVGLQATLYFCDTYEDTTLTTWEGRFKNYTALYERIKKWDIDYYRSDFAFQGQDGINNYNAYEGVMWVIDQLIANEELPNFRYEHCYGGGALKDFTSLERITFMTTEDSGRALAHRNVIYSDTYMINPAQLKIDISIDWMPLENGRYTDAEAWNYYMFRTGLLGAIMVCPSTALSGFTDEQIKAAKDTYAIYNAKQRDIIRNCNVYHILPSPDGVNWDGLEYYNDNIGMGSIMLFRPGNAGKTEDIVYPQGLRADAVYEVTFEDNSSLNVTKTGAELMENGIKVIMDREYDSEVIWLKDISKDDTKVEAIELWGADEVMVLGKLNLVADITPKTVKEDEIVWLSSDEFVATVKNGVVTGLNAGKTTITCMTGDKSVIATKKITVTDTYDSSAFVTVNNTDRSIKYGAGSKAGSGGDTYINYDETHVGEYAEFTFEGSAVRLIGATNVDLGKAKIYLDGAEVAEIDCYSNELYTRHVLFEKLDLDYGTHSIKIVPTREKNDKSKGTIVALDAISYLPLIEAEGLYLGGESMLTLGEKTSLRAGVVPKVNVATSLVWESSDTSVLAVDAEGNVEALKIGKATVTVKQKDGKLVNSMEITVTEKTVTPPDSGDKVDKPTDSDDGTAKTKNGGKGWLIPLIAVMTVVAATIGVVIMKVLKKKKTDNA